MLKHLREILVSLDTHGNLYNLDRPVREREREGEGGREGGRERGRVNKVYNLIDV